MSGAGSPLTNFLSQSPPPAAPTGSMSATSSPTWLQQLLAGTGSAAYNLAQQPYSQFPGPLVASPSGQTKQAWNLAGQNVGNYQPLLNAGSALTQSASQPLSQSDISSFLNPYQNYVTGALNQNLMQNILPGVQDKFVSAGQSRSPQESQMTDQAIYGTQQAAGQALAGGYQGALNSLLQQRQQQQAGGNSLANMGALTQSLGAQDVGALAGAGQAQDVLAQQNLNAGLSQFQQQQQWPYQQIGFLSDIARGLPVQAAGSTTQTAGTQYLSPNSYAPSPLTTLAGSGAQGAALGTGFKRGGHVGALTRMADGGAVSEGPDFAAHLANIAPTISDSLSGLGDVLGGDIRGYASGGQSGTSSDPAAGGDWIDRLPGWTNYIPGVPALQGANNLITSDDPSYFRDLTGLAALAPGIPGIGFGIANNALTPGSSLNNAAQWTGNQFDNLAQQAIPTASGALSWLGDQASGVGDALGLGGGSSTQASTGPSGPVVQPQAPALPGYGGLILQTPNLQTAGAGPTTQGGTGAGAGASGGAQNAGGGGHGWNDPAWGSNWGGGDWFAADFGNSGTSNASQPPPTAKMMQFRRGGPVGALTRYAQGGMAQDDDASELTPEQQAQALAIMRQSQGAMRPKSSRTMPQYFKLGINDPSLSQTLEPNGNGKETYARGGALRRLR